MKKNTIAVLAAALAFAVTFEAAIAAAPGAPSGGMGGFAPGAPGGGTGGFTPGAPSGGEGGFAPGAPGGMGGAFAYDSVINVTTNADSTLSRGSLLYGFTSATKEISASSATSKIADGCFAGCETLTSVDLSSSTLAEVPSDCFAGCTSLESVVLPASCKKIGANAFAACPALVSVKGGTVNFVGADAFRDCVELTTAPTNALSIGICAFANCPRLGSIDTSDDEGGAPASTDTGDGEGGAPASTDAGESENDSTDCVELVENLLSIAADETVLNGSASAIYDGIVLDGDETIGSVKLKVGKANRKTQMARVAVAVNILGRKKVTFTGKATVDGAGEVAVSLTKDGVAMSLAIAGETFKGEIDGFDVVGVRNVSAAKEVRSAEYADWMGTYNVAIVSTDATGAGVGFAQGFSALSVQVLAKGKARVKGVMTDGTKFSVANLPLLLSQDGKWACVAVVLRLYKGKLGGFGFQLWLGEDGTVEVTGLSAWDASLSTSAQFLATLKVAEAAKLSAPSDGLLTFSLDADSFPERIGGLAVDVDRLPVSVSVTASNGRLSAQRGNDASLTISRSVSTGIFTGKFTVFTLNGTKYKRLAAKVCGVSFGGVGYGFAIIKGVASFPLHLF